MTRLEIKTDKRSILGSFLFEKLNLLLAISQLKKQTTISPNYFAGLFKLLSNR